MRLRLEQDLEDLRAAVDKQAARTVAPLARTVDRDQCFSPELWAAVRDLGLTRLPFAVQHGGDGGTVRAYTVATREVARHCAVAALYPGTSIQVAMALLEHGTPAQVERLWTRARRICGFASKIFKRRADMGVLTEIDGPCGIVTLNWPQKRNALGPAEAGEFADALRQVADEPGVKGIVVTGNGAFCAGGDIKGMIARADMPPEERRRLVYTAYQGMITTVIGLPVPTFAAVDGPAVGMGFDIALACDVRIVGPGGWFRQGWAGIGLIPGTGGELLLRLRAPAALWRLIPGQPRVDGAAAEKLGLGETAGAEFADGRSAAVARVHKLGDTSRATLEGYVRLHRADLRARLGDHLAECLATQVALLSDPEFRHRAARAARPADQA